MLIDNYTISTFPNDKLKDHVKLYIINIELII